MFILSAFWAKSVTLKRKKQRLVVSLCHAMFCLLKWTNQKATAGLVLYFHSHHGGYLSTDKIRD